MLLPDGMSPHCSANSQDGGVFYRKQLTLKHPSSACEVKVISRSPCLPACVYALFPFLPLTPPSPSQLLSLGGRRSVLLCRVVVGMWQAPSSPVCGATIDMQQVQSLVEEMGASLSPGAQNLMDMVRVQQLVSRDAGNDLLLLLLLLHPHSPPSFIYPHFSPEPEQRCGGVPPSADGRGALLCSDASSCHPGPSPAC